jgi:hypothetical protein
VPSVPVSDCRFVLTVGIVRGRVSKYATNGYKTQNTRYSNPEKHLFLDISSTNTDTLVPSLYQRDETHSIEVFWLLPQPLPHLVGHHLRLSNILERISRPSCEPLYATNTSHLKQETFIYECPLHWVRLPTTEHCSSVVQSSSPVATLTTETNHWTR